MRTDWITTLHRLWTKAVDTPGYDKEQWLALEAHLLDFERTVAEQRVAIRQAIRALTIGEK